VARARRALLQWWRDAGRSLPWRHPNTSTYKKIVAEVLLQRTRAETVAGYWATFFRKYPTWQALSRATVADLEETLRPIGLSKQRAPRLQALAVVLAKRRGRFPSDPGAIAELPGVGQYVANAIMLFCHATPSPLIDVNMARVIERVFGSRRLVDIRYDEYLQTLATEFVRHRDAEAVNWAMLDLAALVCKPRNPRCDSCPLRGVCRYSRTVKSGVSPRTNLLIQELKGGK
jgi:A/G-specific adenine glycosylase